MLYVCVLVGLKTWHDIIVCRCMLCGETETEKRTKKSLT